MLDNISYNYAEGRAVEIESNDDDDDDGNNSVSMSRAELSDMLCQQIEIARLQYGNPQLALDFPERLRSYRMQKRLPQISILPSN